MRSARVGKIVGDLRASRSRTVLVTLSIATGVAAVGMVAGARSLMLRTLDSSRDEGAFPSATVLADAIPSRLLPEVKHVEGVEDAELRRAVGTRVVAGGTSRDLTLFALPDFDRLRLAKVQRASGAWPPPPGSMLVERSSLGPLGVGVGSGVRLQLPSGRRPDVRVAGTLHDVNVPSTRIADVLYGYVTTETLRRLGDRGEANELLLRAAGDRRAVERVAARATSLLSRSGVVVTETIVPDPGTFWAADPVDSMVLLLTVLAVVCLFMSALLVANVASALVTQQTRQIGVMKAVGASRRATASLYLATAGIYGCAALVLAIPLAAVLALVLVEYSAGLINLDAASFSLPPDVLLLQLGAGLAIPLVAALVPAVAASRITVREAIARVGRGEQPRASRFLAERTARVPVVFRLALTSSLRRKGRLVLTIAALVLGGAVFVGVLSVRSSLLRTLDEAATYRGYDVDVALDRAYPRAAVERAVRGVQGVTRAEAWSVEGAHRLRPDGSESETFSVLGAPAGSALLRPLLVRGRGLRPSDGRAVVVNTDVLDSEHGVGPGDRIRLAVNGRPASTWHVVGVARRIVAGPVIYADRTTLARAAGRPQLARRVVVVTREHGRDAETAIGNAVANRLERSGFGVESVATSAALRSLDRKNFAIIVTFLLAMAGVLAVVGGLGLAGMLSLNVLEHSREIGVLRAVGARDRDVMQVILIEGLFVAIAGWALAAPLGWLVGRGLSDAVGNLFLGAPLVYSYSSLGLLLWLGLALALAVAASALPARRAMRLTVRDVLAYE
jgi:putative ABC transport system permease protein